MTTGLGRGLKDALRDAGVDEERDDKASWISFDWTNETYQWMCMEYRQSLGLVKPNTYESEFETESEALYWMNLYRTRKYGEYIPKQVMADPPESFEAQWVKKRGVVLDTPAASDTKKAESAILTKEQEAKLQDFDRRMEAISIILDGEEIVPDASLINEFLAWVTAEGYRFNMTAFNPSWTYLRKQREAEKHPKNTSAEQQQRVEAESPEPIVSPIPELEKPQKVAIWADLNEKAEQIKQEPIATAPKQSQPKMVWSESKGGFVYNV